MHRTRSATSCALLLASTALSILMACSSSPSSDAARAGQTGGVHVQEVSADEVSACEDERFELSMAAGTVFATTGEHVTEQQLVDDGRLPAPVERYDLDESGEVFPVAGSACEAMEVAKRAAHDAEVAAAAEAASNPTSALCARMRTVFEISVEAYRAKWGAVPPSEQALVDAGILPEISMQYDLDTGGQVLATPDGECAQLEARDGASG